MARELRSATGEVWIAVGPSGLPERCDHRGGLVPDLEGFGATCQWCGETITAESMQAMLEAARRES